MKSTDAKTVVSDDSFVRVSDYASRVEGVHFPPEVWAVFAHTEHPATAAAIAERLKLPAPEVAAALRRLQRRKLVRKHLLGWHEYVAKTAPRTGVAPAPAPLAGASEARVPVVESSRAPRPVESVTVVPVEEPKPVWAMPAALHAVAPAKEAPILSVRLVNDAAEQSRRAARADVVRFKIQPEARGNPEPAAVDAAGRTQEDGRRLRPLLDAIMGRADGLAGQFLVYRVFLRVPAELMAQAGLKSLSLVDDAFRIRDERLYRAIVKAAREVAQVDLDAVGT